MSFQKRRRSLFPAAAVGLDDTSAGESRGARKVLGEFPRRSRRSVPTHRLQPAAPQGAGGRRQVGAAAGGSAEGRQRRGAAPVGAAAPGAAPRALAVGSGGFPGQSCRGTLAPSGGSRGAQRIASLSDDTSASASTKNYILPETAAIKRARVSPPT